MKRITGILLCLCMLFSLFTCAAASAEGYTAESVDQAIRDAESGNADAMAYLGNLYYLGSYKQGIQPQRRAEPLCQGDGGHAALR